MSTTDREQEFREGLRELISPEYYEQICTARDHGWDGGIIDAAPSDAAWLVSETLRPLVDDPRPNGCAGDLVYLTPKLAMLAEYFEGLGDGDAPVLRAAAQAAKTLGAQELRDVLDRISDD